MSWHEALESLARLRVPFQLQFDRDYGIDKRSGWTFSLRGFIRAQFEQTAEAAVIKGLVADAYCGREE